MTKRHVENDLEEVSESVLRELSPSKRTELTLTALADGKWTWIEQLRDTTPRGRGMMIDPRYVERVARAITMGHEAMYRLATTAMTVDHLITLQQNQRVPDEHHGDDPDEAVEKEPTSQKALLDEVEALYVLYHAYDRFATDELGVSLATWLAGYPDSDAILETVTELLNRPTLVSAAEDRYDYIDFDELVERYYEELADTWQEFVDGIIH